jgi:hypothetical protein
MIWYNPLRVRRCGMVLQHPQVGHGPRRNTGISGLSACLRLAIQSIGSQAHTAADRVSIHDFLTLLEVVTRRSFL